MGDGYNRRVLQQFLESQEGKSQMESIAESLRNRKIQNVSFAAEAHCIVATLELDNNMILNAEMSDWDVDFVRDTHAHLLEEEQTP